MLLLWGAAWGGAYLRQRQRDGDDEDSKDHLSLVAGGTLTLLGLIISFTFSMAAARYDLRRTFEENEANAIGTEYLRADLMPGAMATHTKELLKAYTDARIHFYDADYGMHVRLTDDKSQALQGALWNSIRPAAASAPTPVMALVVSGMNDVINTQGYTQFAWWNRIPAETWWLLMFIALFANGLLGYTARQRKHAALLLWILPVLVSVSFFLVADIDAPRGGLIRIPASDLTALRQTMP
jgi:hypothetical protein